MDPPRRTNSSIVSSERHSSQQIQDPITATDPEPSGLRRDRMGGFVRRGHSDGEVHECSATLPRQSRGCNARERMSQSDFSSRVEDGQDQDTDPAEMVVKRRAVIMEDRRRRLSGRLDGYDRRLSFGAFGTGYRGVSCPRQSPSHTTGDEALFRPSSSPGNPFAQRIIDRPLPPRPDEELSRDRRSREISLPRWQPDEEISKCPICGNAFTFWYRKHHCRKCGRVVCANCSPHRITIPRQFIVHTPDASALNPGLRTNIGIEAVDLTSDDANESASHEERPQSSDYQIDPALGGGQEVRLCNPCVPDPNPLPHMPYPSQSYHPFEVRRQTDRIPSCRHRSYSSAQAPSPDEPSPGSGQMSSGPLEYYRSNNNAAVSPPSLDPFVQSSNRRRSHAFHSSSQAISPTQLHTVYGSAPDQPAQQRYLESLLQRHRPSHHHHRHHASMGPIPTTSRTFHIPELIPPALRPQPQPQVMEEDECPICHGALPSKGPDGSEVAREAHVAACVESHFSTSGPGASHAPPSAATNAAGAASGASSSQASSRAITFSSTHRNHTTSDSASPSSSTQARRRTTGMVVYNATEKDCVGQDGEGEAECVICFEEFAVGDEMGRLECLCKFHRKCIRQWWDTKGPGACPVHQEGT